MLNRRFRLVRSLLTIATIAGCSVLGFGLVTWWTNLVPSLPAGPAVGELLPETRVTLVNSDSIFYLNDAIVTEDSCALLVVISTTCPFLLAYARLVDA